MLFSDYPWEMENPGRYIAKVCCSSASSKCISPSSPPSIGIFSIMLRTSDIGLRHKIYAWFSEPVHHIQTPLGRWIEAIIILAFGCLIPFLCVFQPMACRQDISYIPKPLTLQVFLLALFVRMIISHFRDLRLVKVPRYLRLGEARAVNKRFTLIAIREWFLDLIGRQPRGCCPRSSKYDWSYLWQMIVLCLAFFKDLWRSAWNWKNGLRVVIDILNMSRDEELI
jgi:hypothetical protein